MKKKKDWLSRHPVIFILLFFIIGFFILKMLDDDDSNIITNDLNTTEFSPCGDEACKYNLGCQCVEKYGKGSDTDVRPCRNDEEMNLAPEEEERIISEASISIDLSQTNCKEEPYPGEVFIANDGSLVVRFFCRDWNYPFNSDIVLVNNSKIFICNYERWE